MWQRRERNSKYKYHQSKHYDYLLKQVFTVKTVLFFHGTQNIIFSNKNEYTMSKYRLIMVESYFFHTQVRKQLYRFLLQNRRISVMLWRHPLPFERYNEFVHCKVSPRPDFTKLFHRTENNLRELRKDKSLLNHLLRVEIMKSSSPARQLAVH